MRDLIEVNHQQYIWNHPYYYKVNSFFQISLSDYYFTYVKEYTDNVIHNVMGKFPWTYINFFENEMVDSGWKIHVSSELKSHIEVLKIVARYAFDKKINFKFATNLEHFIHINSKNISRASSGKFIVLYPNQNEFLEVIEELYLLLKQYQGPYILSDKSYKDSKVVFYRFGEINPIRYVDEYGTITTRIVNDKNELEIDKRCPFYSKPEWVSELITQKMERKQALLLKKYFFKNALNFTAQGGVYVADKEGKSYVIKEARAFAGIGNNGKSGSERLRTEYDLLKELKETNITPLPIEFVEEFDNSYLVEEFLEGESLRSYPHKYSPYVNMVKNQEKMRQLHREFALELAIIIKGVLQAISLIHEKKIALGDISPANIIFNRDLGSIKFVDLETAFYFTGKDDKMPEMLLTPGFSIEEEKRTVAEIELYKVGLVFLYLIEPYNAFFIFRGRK